MRLTTEHLVLRSPHEVSGAELYAYYCDNREYLKAFEPVREDAFYTEAYQSDALEAMRQDWEAQRAYRFFICLSDTVIGSIALNNVVMGPFRSCFVGYGLSGRYANRGYMTEALQRVVTFAFEEVKLHRLEGNVMPRNLASRAVLQKCGFTCEGISPKYLNINGVWEDHMHYVRLNPALE